MSALHVTLTTVWWSIAHLAPTGLPITASLYVFKESVVSTHCRESKVSHMIIVTCLSITCTLLLERSLLLMSNSE